MYVMLISYNQEGSVMTPLSVTEARSHFADILNRVGYGGERIVLQKHDKKLVAIIPVEDLELLEAIEDRIDVLEAEAALAEDEGKEAITLEKLKEELGL